MCSYLFLSAILVIILTTAAGQGNIGCSRSECVSISDCPEFLKLVRKMKSGDHAARKKIVQNQCGFEKSLPKVCCQSIATAPLLPKPQRLQTAKHSENVPEKLLPRREKVRIPYDCGRSRMLSNRIVNGDNSARNAWPWIAALGYKDDITGEVLYRCGASLVTSRHLVTAAHCVNDDLATVLLGEHVIGSTEDGAEPQEFRIVKVKAHEGFVMKTYTNDIAVVEIEKDVDFNEGIQPVCLPSHTPGKMKEDLTHQNVYIAGWGRTSWGGPKSDILQEAVLTVISNQECSRIYAKFPDVEVRETKLCAGADSKLEVGACLGDSGGPLVLLRQDLQGKYRYHMMGIVSSGYSRCHMARGYPDLYTRVTSYDEWIKNTINNM